MADNFEAYMFFVGRGKYMAKNGDSYKEQVIGRIEGEALDLKFREHGGFAITQFSWSCGSSEAADEDTTEIGLDDGQTKSPRKPKHNAHRNRKPTVNAFTVQKDIDIATPMLFRAGSTGSEFPAAHIYFRKSGGGAKMFTYLHLVFGLTIIESWNMSLPATRAEETIAVRFKWCTVMYYPQQVDGTRNKGKLKTADYCVMTEKKEAPPPEMDSPEDLDMDAFFAS